MEKHKKISRYKQVKELEKQVRRHKYLADARGRELIVKRELLDAGNAKVDAAMLFVTVAMKRIGVSEIEITKAELTEAMKTKIEIENYPGKWLLRMGGKPDHE
jgi:hypothetical protein